MRQTRAAFWRARATNHGDASAFEKLIALLASRAAEPIEEFAVIEDMSFVGAVCRAAKALGPGLHPDWRRRLVAALLGLTSMPGIHEGSTAALRDVADWLQDP